MVELSLARVIDDLEAGKTTDWASASTWGIDGRFPCRGAMSFWKSGIGTAISRNISPSEDWSNYKELICMLAASASVNVEVFIHDVVAGSQKVGSTVSLSPYKYVLFKGDISALTLTQVDKIEFLHSAIGMTRFIDDILLSRKEDNYITLEPKPAVWNLDMVMRIPETDIPNRVGGILQGVGSMNQRLAIEGLFKKGTTHQSSYYYLMKKLQSYAHNNNVVVFTDPDENFTLPGMISNVSFKRGSKKEWFPYDFDFTEFAELGGEDL